VQATFHLSLRFNRWRINRFLVRAAISGVVREAVIAACLTGLMILLFLGSWRSTLIIAIRFRIDLVLNNHVECAARNHQH